MQAFFQVCEYFMLLSNDQRNSQELRKIYFLKEATKSHCKDMHTGRERNFAAICCHFSLSYERRRL